MIFLLKSGERVQVPNTLVGLARKLHEFRNPVQLVNCFLLKPEQASTFGAVRSSFIQQLEKAVEQTDCGDLAELEQDDSDVSVALRGLIESETKDPEQSALKALVPVVQMNITDILDEVTVMFKYIKNDYIMKQVIAFLKVPVGEEVRADDMFENTMEKMSHYDGRIEDVRPFMENYLAPYADFIDQVSMPPSTSESGSNTITDQVLALNLLGKAAMHLEIDALKDLIVIKMRTLIDRISWPEFREALRVPEELSHSLMDKLAAITAKINAEWVKYLRESGKGKKKRGRRDKRRRTNDQHKPTN